MSNCYYCNCCNPPRYEVRPYTYYKKKCDCYVMELEAKYGTHLWSMHTSCDGTARELYSQMTGRKSNVMNLVLTIEQADELFELFKTFTNVWAYKYASK